MATPLSPLDTDTGMTRDQVATLIEMIKHGLLNSVVFAGAPIAQVDEFIESVGPDMSDVLVELAEHRFQAFSDCYRIPVNYSLANAIAVAIEANAFDGKYLGINVADIPLIGTGEAVEQVRIVDLDIVIGDRGLREALKRRGIADGFKNGYMFANPLTALLFALKNPYVKKDHPLGIMFYAGARLCYLDLRVVDCQRKLVVSRFDWDNSHWSGSVRFLVVPATAPVPA